MLTLLKNLECFAPGNIGKNDILICCDKIYKIQPDINISDTEILDNVFDFDGYTAFPGLIDQHVHIIGGGGEKGFSSRTPEIDINLILSAGVTTIVGLLGADNATRTLEALYAKAKILDDQGISCYIYSGCYSIPPITFTGEIVKDLVFVDKVIGIGEVAISDHRSSNAAIEQLLKAASDVHLGGLISGKAGVMHLHIGDGKGGLGPLLDMLEKSDLPIEQFVPTHVNRNESLFQQAISYCKSGGYIDLTAGETQGVSVPDAIKRLADSQVDLARVTISSDSNGSGPGGSICSILSLHEDIVKCIKNHKINAETVFGFVTENVSRLLKIYPAKGTLKPGSDADILITDKDYNVRKLFGKGRLLLDA